MSNKIEFYISLHLTIAGIVCVLSGNTNAAAFGGSLIGVVAVLVGNFLNRYETAKIKSEETNLKNSSIKKIMEIETIDIMVSTIQITKDIKAYEKSSPHTRFTIHYYLRDFETIKNLIPSIIELDEHTVSLYSNLALEIRFGRRAYDDFSSESSPGPIKTSKMIAELMIITYKSIELLQKISDEKNIIVDLPNQSKLVGTEEIIKYIKNL